MEKRYQVFVSSTYADLIDERRHVIQTLMQMDCIPAGMELFPAADEEQWQFIKRVIDDCDYYILIIGGRYGSTTPDGVSYTEKEYEYAIERGLKVLAFVHEKPDEIPVGKSDINAELRARLSAFRQKAMTGRLVRFWKSANELPGLVALSLGQTIKLHPAVGWVRGNQVATSEVLNELNQLRIRNQELEVIANAEPVIADIAGMEETIEVSGTHWGGRSRTAWKVTVSWGKVFVLIAPHLLSHPSDLSVKIELGKALHDLLDDFFRGHSDVTLDDQSHQTIKIQFIALGLVNVDYTSTVNGGMGLFWWLTPQGKAALIQLRTVRTRH